MLSQEAIDLLSTIDPEDQLAYMDELGMDDAWFTPPEWGNRLGGSWVVYGWTAEEDEFNIYRRDMHGDFDWEAGCGINSPDVQALYAEYFDEEARQASWKAYYAQVAETGDDYLGCFNRPNNPNVPRTYQIRIQRGIAGARVVWIRANGRGPVKTARESWPRPLMEYLNCCNAARLMDDYAPRGELSWDDLVAAGFSGRDDVRWQPRLTKNGVIQGFIKVQEPKYTESVYHAMLRKHAKEQARSAQHPELGY